MKTPVTESPDTPLQPLLETDLLRTFVAIAETGSFTRAAQQVFRTPSALSMQIKRLEQMLGSALFVREARRVRLTPEGEELLGYGRRLLKLNEEAVARFLAPDLEGNVRFGTPDDVGTRILPGLLSRFARSHPAVQVDVMVGRSTEMIARLDGGELDLALVTAGNPGQDPARGEVVHSEPLLWAARDGGVAWTRTPLPLALAAHGCAWRATALEALDAAGLAYRVAYTSENCAGQEAAMQADLAVAPFPASLIRPPLRTLDGLPPLADYRVLMYRRPGCGPAGEALAGYVSDAFRSMRRP
ncbi:MAG: LysR family transcriptional regulator [Ectothiorhodospiraceae bacterium]|nr:LysR family transcriptional regulator [Ectothiorhodospiraceae bacterium]MCH8503000.1 LysR family transcriptional regulator [Ectothiorhodospiraceae bacterium]